MNESLAIEIAKCKMREQGHGENYTLRVRHFLLNEGETRDIKAGSDFYILFNAGAFLRVKSQAGIFDVTFPKSNEMQYVHTGNISLTNMNESFPIPFMFLQVIPLIPKTPSHE